MRSAPLLASPGQSAGQNDPSRCLLRCLYIQRHARHVRHATPEDLDRAETLLVELRKLPQLRERKRGYFSRGSRAFLHFHEDAGHLYVDVRFDSAFQRVRVTSPNEQADLLSRVQKVLQSAASPGMTF
jgi:hypothetical protein